MSHLRSFRIFPIVVGLLLLAAFPCHAQVLYGVTRTNPAKLITINTTTGAGTLVGNLSGSVRRPTGLAFRGGKLLVFEKKGTDQLWDVDPLTAGTLTKIDFATNVNTEGDIAFRSDGIGFVVDNRLIRIDVTIPNFNIVGPLGATVDGLAFNSSDVLYALVQGGGALNTVNTNTGAMTLVGNTGLSGYNLGGMAFDASGNLYAALSTVGGPSSLYKFDPTTAAPTLIGNIGFNEVSGLAIQGTGPAPPPPAGYILYGTTWTGQLIAIDTTTGVGSLFGTNPPIRPLGLDFLGANAMIFDQATGKILQLDPTNGNTAAAVSIGLAAGGGEGDMAFRSDGIGFIAQTGPSQLIQFDLSVPTSNVIGPLSQQYDGLAFDATDVLFALRERCTQLYTIDPVTAVETLVGSTGVTFNNNSVGGLAFDVSGNLYAAMSDGVGSPSYLYKINPATGAATLIGNIGFNGVSGIRFGPGSLPPPSPPPPPAPPLPGGPGAPGEGTYDGGAGGGVGGGEGAFGFGRSQLVAERNRPPMLQGPMPDGFGGWKVLNVSHRPSVVPMETSAIGIPGWTIYSVLALALIACLFGFFVSRQNGRC